MSIESMAVALHHSRATGTAKVVLLGIANHDGDGGAWPAIATLAKYANASESAVHRAITALTKLDEIRVHRQAGGTVDTRADRRPNRYELLLICPPNCDGTTNHGVASLLPRSDHGVPDSRPRGAADASHGVPLVAPEPSLEPSLNLQLDAEAPSRPRLRERFPEYDAIVAVWGEPGTREEAAFFAKQARLLRDQGKSPTDIEERGRIAMRRYDHPTPAVLARRWAQLVSRSAQGSQGVDYDRLSE